MAKSSKPMTKAEIFETIAKELGKTKAEVKEFFAALETLMAKQLGKKGGGVFALPGTVRITAIPKKAVKGGKMVKNPFTGEMVMSKDKPATVKIRARAGKAFIEKLK